MVSASGSNATADEAAARAFMNSSAAKEGVEYEWVYEYAKSLWAHRLTVWRMLDEKADAIIRYLGGGTGIFALGVLAKIDASNRYLAEWALPALFIASIAVFLAMWARRPMDYPLLPSVENAKDYADEHKEDAKAAFIGQWHLANEKARLSCARKERWISWAAFLAYIALVLLLLPVIVGICTPPPAR